MKNSLLHWYKINKRDLPWRQTRDPYRIWLSEVILQQTRVEQGLPYYLRFVENYPDVFAMAAATEDAILKLWQGLGYYSRARNMHTAAKYIAHELKGRFPSTYEEIKKLKGVGEYTAAAIASFAYGEPRAVVDGNVYRVLARYFGVELPINSGEGVRTFKKIAQDMLYYEDPGIYNQAIMEFGALYCVPRNPDCDNCIFRSECRAAREGKVAQLPIKLGKTKVRTRYFNYLFWVDDDNILLQKRTGNDIWKNLYEFPLVETSQATDNPQLLQEQASAYGLTLKSAVRVARYTHKLSHQTIEASFWSIKKNDRKVLNLENSSIFELSLKKLSEIGTSRLIEKFLTDQNLANDNDKQNHLNG